MKKQPIILFIIGCLIFISGIWYLNDQNKKRHEESREYYERSIKAFGVMYDRIDDVYYSNSTIQDELMRLRYDVDDLSY